MGLMCFWARGNVSVVYEQSKSMFDAAGINESQLVGLYALIGILAVVLCFLNMILAFAPMTRKWWKAHIFNHVIGILECCCVPLAVPLVFLWLRPDVKALFDESLPPVIPYSE